MPVDPVTWPADREAFRIIAVLAGNAETIPPPLLQAFGRLTVSALERRVADPTAAIQASLDFLRFIHSHGWLQYPDGYIPGANLGRGQVIPDDRLETLGQLIAQAAAHATYFYPVQIAYAGQQVSEAFAGRLSPADVDSLIGEMLGTLEFAANFWRRPTISEWSSWATAGVGTGGSGACPFPWTNGLPCEFGSSQRFATDDPDYAYDYVHHGFSTTPARNYHAACQVVTDWAVEIAYTKTLAHGSGLTAERCAQVLPASSRDEAVAIAQSLPPKQGYRFYLLFRGQRVEWSSVVPAQGGIGYPGGVATGHDPSGSQPGSGKTCCASCATGGPCDEVCANGVCETAA